MSSNTILDLLLIQSYDIDWLIEDYRLFFLSLIPSMFVFVCLVEYFDRLNWLGACRRALISILILCSVTFFYKATIYASIDAADSKLQSIKQSNILLMDMLDGGKYLDSQSPDKSIFYKDDSIVSGTFKFLKYHLFDSFINDGFTVGVFFIAKLCYFLIKAVYSLVYYLGLGLIGIPCLLYMFPTMGNVLRGSILSFIWCLVVPHILVFIISLLGAEINRGYVTGQVIGGSVAGTVLLFIMALFIAFTPLIAMMMVNGSGMAHAGGIIASIGANYAMNLPKNITDTASKVLIGAPLGPKAQLAKAGAKGTFELAKNTINGGKKKLLKNNSSRKIDSKNINPRSTNKTSYSSTRPSHAVAKTSKEVPIEQISSNQKQSVPSQSKASKREVEVKRSSAQKENNNNQTKKRERTNNARISKHSRIDKEFKTTNPRSMYRNDRNKPNNGNNSN